MIRGIKRMLNYGSNYGSPSHFQFLIYTGVDRTIKQLIKLNGFEKLQIKIIFIHIDISISKKLL